MSQDGGAAPARFDEFAPAGGAGGFFRGAELPKLLLLVAIAVVGWALAWTYISLKQEPAGEPEPAARTAAPKVEPDTAPAFESVTDRTTIGLRDMAAYALLLQRARKTSAADLAAASHRDIYFTDLWERPDHFRGVPIHLLGNARRIISYESKLSTSGVLYEAWVSTHESQGYPYVCVFEELPKGLPLGTDLSERVVFNGYFLKEMRYLSGKDVQRAAPVLIGRIGWTAGRGEPRRDSSIFWMALIVLGMFVISLCRWIVGLRRSLSGGSRAAALGRRPTDEIAPDDLAQWVESVQHDDREPTPDHE